MVPNPEFMGVLYTLSCFLRNQCLQLGDKGQLLVLQLTFRTLDA
jgi:hypothetical protein